MSEDTLLRWDVTIWYRTKNGAIDVVHHVEEIHEVHDLIERGPDWNTIEHIEIRLARACEPDLTIEDTATIIRKG